MIDIKLNPEKDYYIEKCINGWIISPTNESDKFTAAESIVVTEPYVLAKLFETWAREQLITKN